MYTAARGFNLLSAKTPWKLATIFFNNDFGEIVVTQDRASHFKGQKNAATPNVKGSYYDLLGISPTATAQEVRQAYREQSKLFHPDTTQLPPPEARQRFHVLNEAYATLSNPVQRLQYDQKAGFSRFTVVQPPAGLNKSVPRQPTYSSSAYLDPNDRPLSAGEIFALVILGFTFLICLVLAIVLSFTQGDLHLGLHPPLAGDHSVLSQVETVTPHPDSALESAPKAALQSPSTQVEKPSPPPLTFPWIKPSDSESVAATTDHPKSEAAEKQLSELPTPSQEVVETQLGELPDPSPRAEETQLSELPIPNQKSEETQLHELPASSSVMEPSPTVAPESLPALDRPNPLAEERKSDALSMFAAQSESESVSTEAPLSHPDQIGL